MTRSILPLLAMLPLCFATSAWASCSTESVRQALPVREAARVPLSLELAGAPALPGFAAAVFMPSSSEALALERVLLRQRLANCVVDEFAGYEQRTQFDNTPWRFNAGGEGKKFEADEFDAWMKKRGVRIARGKGTDVPAAAEPEPAPAVAQ